MLKKKLKKKKNQLNKALKNHLHQIIKVFFELQNKKMIKTLHQIILFKISNKTKILKKENKYKFHLLKKQVVILLHPHQVLNRIQSKKSYLNKRIFKIHVNIVNLTSQNRKMIEQ